jgi:hypothetical protein
VAGTPGPVSAVRPTNPRRAPDGRPGPDPSMTLASRKTHPDYVRHSTQLTRSKTAASP